jgi:ABC-type multidrug transport system fused ATPase/permease subunit
VADNSPTATPSTAALLLYAIRTLVRASPAALVVVVVTALLQGIGPTVVTLASARVIGLAPQLAGSPSAGTAAAAALTVLGVALLIERSAAALTPVTTAYLSFRFAAALDRIRIHSCTALPGVEHFESRALADHLQAAGWSRSAPATLLERLITFIRRGAMLAGSLLILVRLSWWVPLLISLSAVAVGVNDWRHAGRRTALQRERTTRLRYADYHREVAVDPTHAREVRLFGLGRWLAERQLRFWQEGTARIFADLHRQLGENSVLNLLRGATLVVPVLVALARFRDGSISVEVFAASVFALRTASNGMYVLEGIPGGLRETIAFLPEVVAIERLPDRDPRLHTGGRRSAPRTLVDGIRFEGVVFRYPDQTRPALDGLDLHLRPGRSLALVGENGAGKSTVVKLLCRLYDPDAGRITLDGTDIREFDLAEFRRRFAVIFQDFARLPLAARDNLTAGFDEPGPDIETLRAAAGDAGAEDVFDALPHGWNTPLSREFGGIDLSGGQWQRLALARLLLAKETRQPPILVLDEPTSALDVRVEADLYERFEQLTAGATTLLISHRFSTVRMADRVAVLEGGRIIEEGVHGHLVRAEGRYAELFELQARHFQPGDVIA